MIQVDLIRRHALKYVSGSLRIFISGLPDREQVALERLYGVEGVKTAAAIADFVLVQLGHCPPTMTSTSPTVRVAREYVPSLAAMPADPTATEATSPKRRSTDSQPPTAA